MRWSYDMQSPQTARDLTPSDWGWCAHRVRLCLATLRAAARRSSRGCRPPASAPQQLQAALFQCVRTHCAARSGAAGCAQTPTHAPPRRPCGLPSAGASRDPRRAARGQAMPGLPREWRIYDPRERASHRVTRHRRRRTGARSHAWHGEWAPAVRALGLGRIRTHSASTTDHALQVRQPGPGSDQGCCRTCRRRAWAACSRPN